MQTKSILAGLWMAGMIVSGVAQATPTYSITKLDGSAGWSFANSINDNGQIAGYTYVNTPMGTRARSYVYENGVTTYLGTLGGSPGDATQARSINNNGQVVGSAAIFGNGNSQSFLYSYGKMSNLGGNYTEAYGLNNIGQVVGYTDGYAFLKTNSSFTNLGWGYGTALAINDHTQVVGYANVGGGSQARMYENGVTTQLGTLGGSSSAAYAINNNGQVVGWADTQGSSSGHSFLYSSGKMTNLGTLGGTTSIAFGINDSGQVVGYSALSSNQYPYHGYLYNDGQMTDLNDLIDPSSGWVINQASDINNAGQIVGWGNLGAYLLTPIAAVPEPETYTMMLLGLGLLVGSAKRKKKVAT